MKCHYNLNRTLLFTSVVLNWIAAPVRAQKLMNFIGRLFCGIAETRVGALIGGDVACSCSLTFPFRIKFSCQFTTSYCIGPQDLIAVCGKPKFTGSYGLGVNPWTEICFAGDSDNPANLTHAFCLKAFYDPNFIAFQKYCNATYDSKTCALCEACADIGGYNIRIDCNAVGGPVVPCFGLVPN